MASAPLDDLDTVARLSLGPRSDTDILAFLDEPEDGTAVIQRALEPPPPEPTENQQLAEQMWQERWGRTDTPEKIAIRLGLGIGSGIGALEKAAGGVLEAPSPPLSALGAIERQTPAGAMLRRARTAIGGRLRARGKATTQEYDELGETVQSGALGDIGQALTATAVASAPTIPAAALGGVPLAAIAAGTQSFGQTFSDAKDHYGNEQDALIPAVAAGLSTGLLTAGFGRTGIESLGAGLTRGTITSILKEITKQAGFEAAEEGLDQVGQSIIAKLSYRPEMRLDEAINETLLAAGAGALMGGAVRTGAETFGRAAEGAQNVLDDSRFARASRETARQTALRGTFRTGTETRNIDAPPIIEQTPEQQALDKLVAPPTEVSGWTLKPNGTINLEGLTPEQQAQIPQMWELTDARPESPTYRTTVYVPAGADVEMIKSYIARKSEEVIAADQAYAATKAQQAAPVAPPTPQQPAPRQPRQRPEVPGTPAEERKSVLQEIRDAQAMTIGQIQALFPQAQLTREQARVYRRMAWPEIPEAAPLQESRPPVPATGTAKPKNLPAPPAPVAQTPEVGPHKLADIQKIASGAGVITVYHGTTQDNADRILAGGVSLPESGEATAQQVARAYGIPWIEFRERITRDAGYGTAVAQLSTAPLDVARLWAKGFPGGEVMANFNSAARLHVASKQTGLTMDQLYDKAEEVAKRLGRQFTYESAADLLGLPNKFPLQQRGGAVIAFDVDVRNIPKRVRDKAASILKNAPPENVEQFWNSTYQDIKVAPGKLSNPRLVERVEPEYPGPQPPTQLTPAAQIQQPPPPAPVVVPPPVAPPTYPDAPQFPLKPRNGTGWEEGWLDQQNRPVELVPDATSLSGNRWRVAAPTRLEETPSEPAQPAPPKVSKLRSRVASKKEPKGQISKRLPKRAAAAPVAPGTDPMTALMARIAAKEQTTAPTPPEVTTAPPPVAPPKVSIPKTEADVQPAPDHVMHDAGVQSTATEWSDDRVRRQAALGYGMIKGKWQKVTKENLSAVQADVRALNKRRLEQIGRMRDYAERFNVKPTDEIDESTFRQQTGTSYDQQTLAAFVQAREAQIRATNEYVRGLEKQLRRAERGFISGSKAEQWADDYIAKAPQKTNLGADPVLAVAGAIKGLAILERGVRDFAAWSAQMLTELGDWASPHLQRFYEHALELEADDRKLAAAENLLKIRQASMVTAQVPAVQEVVAQIKAEILVRNQRGQAPILTGEALDRQRAFDRIAAHPLIKRWFMGPVERMEEVMTATDGAFTTYAEIKADPDATPVMRSGAAGIAVKQLDGFYTQLRRFRTDFDARVTKLMDKMEQANEASAETTGEADVLNVLLNDFQTFGREIAYQARDVGAVRAFRQALGRSGGVRNVLGFVAKFVDVTQPDIMKQIEDHAQPFINEDRSFEQVVGASRDTVEMVVRYIEQSEPLRARLKEGKDMLDDKVVADGKNVLSKFKSALAEAVRAGDINKAVDLYTKGVGTTATARDQSRRLANFFKQAERRLITELMAIGQVKTYVDQVVTSPGFVALSKDVYRDLNVRLVNRGIEGTEYVLDPVFDEKPTKLFLKPDGSLLEQNMQALKTYHDLALVYLSDPEAPGYDPRKAAGLQALLDDWAQFTNPFFNPGARKFVPSFQRAVYRTMFGWLGRIDLIPQFILDRAGGMSSNLAHRTLNALLSVQELKISIMRKHDPKLLRLEAAAMKSHKMMGDVDGYRDLIYAPLEESLQYFENIHQLGVGSPIGNGHVITKEDMAYHEAVRTFEKDAMNTAAGVGVRAFQSIKANPGGILYKRDGQTYIRTPFETGPGTTHRRLGRMRQWVTQWQEAATPEQKAAFINRNVDRFLFGYVLGATNPQYRFTYSYAEELRGILAEARGGAPITSLENLVERILEKRLERDDVEEEVTADQVQAQILSELDAMFANYRKYNPAPKEGDKTIAFVFGGEDSFNTERGQPIVPPLWYDYGSVTTSERLGFLHNMTAKFAVEHYNAVAALDAVLKNIASEFEEQAKTRAGLEKQSRRMRERGELFYSWGEAKKLSTDVTAYLTKLKAALDFQVQVPELSGGRLDPKSLVSPFMDMSVASALTGPSAMIMNMFGGGRSMAIFDQAVRNQGTIASLFHNGRKLVAGAIREAANLMAHEGNPVGRAIGEFLNSARTKPLVGGIAQGFYDYLMSTRDLYKLGATEGLHLNVDLFNTIATEWMWRESGGVAGQTPDGIIARKIVNPVSTMFRMFAEVVKQGGVGFVDSRLNVRSVQMERDLEQDLKRRAILYGPMRAEVARTENRDPYDVTDVRNQFSAKELVGGRLPDAAAIRFRQLLAGYGDINVDAAMMDFYQRWLAAGEPEDVQSLTMFTDEQRRQLTLAIAADHNLATWATRPLAVRTGRAAARIGLFQGYPAWYMHKMAQLSDRLTGKGWTKGRIENLPTMIGAIMTLVVVGSVGQGLVEEAIRRLLNRQSRFPTLFDFNQSAKSYALTLLNGAFNQWPMVGDFGNFLIQRAFRRGFDFNSRMYFLNYATSFMDMVREFFQTGKFLRPALKFATRWTFPLNYIGPHLPIMSGMNELSRDRNAWTSAAHQLGIEARLKAPFSATDITLTRSTGPANDFSNAVGNHDMQGVVKAFTDLVNVKREEGSADPVGAAQRLIQARNPLTQVFGAKPSAEEMQALFSVMRPEDADRVRKNMAFYDQAVQAVGGAPVSFIKESGSGGGGGGGGTRSSGSGAGGGTSGGIPAARRAPAPPRLSPGVFRSGGGLRIGPAATFRLAIPRIRTGIGRLRGRSKVVRVKGGRRRTGGRLRSRLRIRR